jgi:uncharacterized damage-inducible protein DinB
MRISPLFALTILMASAISLAAQTQKAGDSGNSAVSAARMLWEQPTQYITTVAEELPESTYAFRPTPEVRSLGQVIGHVAGAQYLICAAALGEPARREDDIEKTRTRKVDLVAALKASTQYCTKAYAQNDRSAQQTTKLFGQERTRLFALGLNANHNAEHYGNLVTYLRLNGIVPPSSRRGS